MIGNAKLLESLANVKVVAILAHPSDAPGKIEVAPHSIESGVAFITNASANPFSPISGASIEMEAVDTQILSKTDVMTDFMKIGKCECGVDLRATASMAKAIKESGGNIHCVVCSDEVEPEIDEKELEAALAHEEKVLAAADDDEGQQQDQEDDQEAKADADTEDKKGDTGKDASAEAGDQEQQQDWPEGQQQDQSQQASGADKATAAKTGDAKVQADADTVDKKGEPEVKDDQGQGSAANNPTTAALTVKDKDGKVLFEVPAGVTFSVKAADQEQQDQKEEKQADACNDKTAKATDGDQPLDGNGTQQDQVTGEQDQAQQQDQSQQANAKEVKAAASHQISVLEGVDLKKGNLDLVQASAKDDSVYYVFHNQEPVARLRMSKASDDLKAVFAKEIFPKAFITAARLGITAKDEARFGMEPISVAFSPDIATAKVIEAKTQEITASVDSRVEVAIAAFEQAAETASLAMLKNLKEGDTNPLREAIVAFAIENGMENPDKAVDACLAGAIKPFLQKWISDARELVKLEPAAREQYAKTVATARYMNGGTGKFSVTANNTADELARGSVVIAASAGEDGEGTGSDQNSVTAHVAQGSVFREARELLSFGRRSSLRVVG